MSDKPILTEHAEKLAQEWLDKFKARMLAVCDEVLGEVYVNCMPWIESDSWMNLRNASMDRLRGYQDLPGWDAKEVRESILRKHRDQIIDDLNQDHLERIKELEKLIQDEREMRRRYY